MKHASPEALDALEPLLEELRSLNGLREAKRGVFYIRSRAFLHFHEDPAGFFCDIRLDPCAGFERFPVNSKAERLDVLSRVAVSLVRESRTS